MAEDNICKSALGIYQASISHPQEFMLPKLAEKYVID
jgi:hypothetical protein